jgi:hypothetical protein
VKLTDPIPATKIYRFSGTLLIIGAVLLVIAGLLRIFGVDSYGTVGAVGAGFAVISYSIWFYLGLPAERDDEAIAANKHLRADEPKHRVGTAPWAYWALGAAIVAIALMFAVTFLFGT